jgi:hypothetical protein
LPSKASPNIKGGPELVFDVFDRIDAEAVEVGELGPARVGVDHGGAHLGVLRGHVFEPTGEVAGEQLLLDVVIEGAALAVVRRGGAQDAGLRGDAVDGRVLDEDERRAAGLAQRGERLNAAGVEVGVELAEAIDGGGLAGAADVDVGLAVEVHVVEEHLPHVVGDDVEHHLETTFVRRGRELA